MREGGSDLRDCMNLVLSLWKNQNFVLCVLSVVLCWFCADGSEIMFFSP
jgi:hypothetical protein